MSNRFGRYELVEELGRGGMGDVWLARDPELGRDVAIKTIRREVAGPDVAERFLREARAAAQCRHPGIVTIFDFGVQDGAPFLVMERVVGRTLRQLLDAKGPLPLERAMRIGAQVAEALQHAHDLGVLHRDVTPSNVVIDGDGVPRLLDFGLVRDLGSPTSEMSTQAMLGTPAYIAPEQAFGAPEEVDARADVYGLGATLYTVVTGRPPFEGATLLALLRSIEEQEVAPTGAGAEVDAVLGRALAKDRDDRYPTAAAFAEALVAWRTARPRRLPESRPMPSRPPAAQWSVVLSAIAILITWLLSGRERDDGDVVQTLHAEVFALAETDGEEDPRLELVAEGRFGEAAAVRPIASLDSWVALTLCAPEHLRRYIDAAAFHAPFVAPVAVADGSAAAAGMHVLAGRSAPALETVDALRASGAPAPMLDLIELHALLTQEADAFDEPRAEALLERITRMATTGDGTLRALGSAGLLDLLRLRLGFDEPLFFDVDARTDVLERELVASLLLAGAGRFDDAIGVVRRMREAEPDDPWIAVHLGWLAMAAAIDERETFALEELEQPLRALAADGEPALRYVAALLLCVHATLADDGVASRRAAQVAQEVAEEEGYEPDLLPGALAALVGDHGEEGTWAAQARREVFEAFGQTARALEIGRRIDADGARDLDDEQERRELLSENALACARCVDDEAQQLRYVLRAIDLGADEERLHEDEELEPLLEVPEVQERLRR